MNIGDRVKQAGTATSDTAYAVAGAAATGFQTFFDGFQMPANADLGGTLNYPNVTVLVETETEWQIITGTVSRDSSDVVSIGSGVVRASSTGSALGLTGSEAVTLSPAPSMWGFNMIALGVRTPVDKADGYVQNPSVSNGGLMALGPRSFASKKHATAQGQNAYVHAAYEDALGCGNWPDGEGGAAMLGRGVLMGKTTDDTPTLLSAFDQFGAIASSNAVAMDSGLYIVRGTVSAIDMATFDTKVWDVAFCVLTAADYSSSAIVGTPVYTEAQESAGATSWGVAASVDSGANTFGLEVTGEAATDITWVFSYTRHHHIVYP